MESIIKELPIPKETTKMLEEVPAIQELIEPESSGLNWYQGVGIVALVVIVAAVIKKSGCCKKK